MENCKIILSQNPSKDLEIMVTNFIVGFSGHAEVVDLNNINYKDEEFRNTKILLAVEVNSIGTCLSLNKFFLYLSECLVDPFKNSVGVMIIRSNSDLYTKSLSRQYLNIANKLGLSFLGHGVVEATKDFKNYKTWPA